MTILGKFVVFVFILGCVAGAWWLLGGDFNLPIGGAQEGEEGQRQSRSRSVFSGDPVTIGIAYGTEKRRWLEWAVEEFENSEEGRKVKVELIPMGSLEGAQAALAGDERIHVWSPASALYTDVFVRDWTAKHGNEPLLTDDPLALTPMVFVMWKQRYDAYLQRYSRLDFVSISEALQERSGWASISNKPEWGLFKVGHTHPNESNSGLMSLVLMSYTYHQKTQGLELADILDGGFQDWMQQVEGSISGLANSTGNMMRDMVLKGPSTYDALFVYENLAIDYLKNAQGRWGDLQVAYPNRTLWNENPYYVLDAPWSTEDHHEGAQVFLDFLLSEPVQRQALVHGFRPANPQVPILFPESPFVRLERFGLQVDLPTACEDPRAEVVENLLLSWQRGQARR
ncbi:MAG: substrate-binding domain-containing protein [Acidobacteriota bacterium]